MILSLLLEVVVDIIQAVLAIVSFLNLNGFYYPLQPIIRDGASFDYIIIGAGSAGSVLANRLSEDPSVSVLLIEAGTNPPIECNIPITSPLGPGSIHDWDYKTYEKSYKCHRNGEDTLSRGKMLGGSSSLNYMHYVRGNPHDYDQWADIVDDDSWKYDNVLPYFKKSERLENSIIANSETGNFHGTNGLQGISYVNMSITKNYLKSFEELGHRIMLDTNGRDTLGYSQAQVYVAEGIRQSTANAFLRNVRNRSNLYVVRRFLATKINSENNKAVSVDTINQNTIFNRRYTFLAKKEIIVSGGAINTPQLLMLSGIGPAEHLKSFDIPVIADLPVGENFHDHKLVSVLYAMNKSSSLTHILNLNIKQFPLSLVVGFVALNKSQTYPDYQTSSLVLTPEIALLFCSVGFKHVDKVCLDLYKKTQNQDVFYTLHIPLHPKSRGRVLLKSKDPTVYPDVHTEPYTNKNDLDNEINFLKDFARLEETTYFKELGAKLVTLDQCSDFGTDTTEYWKCHAQCLVNTVYHFVGTCSMGKIVDSRMRVYNMKRLRVVDASVMPTITSGNTNAPTIMIAEMAADMIKQDNSDS